MIALYSQPQSLDLIIDNVAPVMTVTHVTQQINLADRDKAVNNATINGTASDAGQMARLSLIIRKPNGDTITEALTPSTLRQAVPELVEGQEQRNTQYAIRNKVTK